MNEFPKKGDSFLFRKIYRFIPNNIKHARITFIELEIYTINICVVAFYDQAYRSSDNRYRIRTNIKAGQIKGIFKACLEAYEGLEERHALVFAASNDVGDIVEDNARYSAYKLFLSYYLKDYEEYQQIGSIKYNTLMLYHKDYPFKDLASEFYDDYELKISREIDDEIARNQNKNM